MLLDMVFVLIFVVVVIMLFDMLSVVIFIIVAIMLLDMVFVLIFILVINVIIIFVSQVQIMYYAGYRVLPEAPLREDWVQVIFKMIMMMMMSITIHQRLGW